MLFIDVNTILRVLRFNRLLYVAVDVLKGQLSTSTNHSVS